MSLKAERELRQGMLRLVKPKDREFDALVGDGNGVIEVPGHPDQWYVRPIGSDLPLVVKRGAAPKVEGIRVRIGREFGENKRRKGRLAIYGVVVSNTGSTVGGLEPHAGTHLAGQSDPVYIDAVQIINGLAYASSGMTVKVNPGWTVISGQPVRWSLQTIDMTSHIPVSGALFALIRVDDTGTFDVQEGGAVDNYVDLSWPDVPAVEDGYKAWAIVRLYEGQAALSRLYANPDVISLHITPDTGGGGGGGGASAFTDLTDTFASYAGLGGYGLFVNDAEDGIEALQVVPDAVEIVTNDVSNPPTEAQLMTAFGTPDEFAAQGKIGVVNDNAAGNRLYAVFSDGGHYWLLSLAKSTAPSVGVSVDSTALIAESTSGEWYGRAAMEVLPSGVVVMVYAGGSSHSIIDGVIHIRFSDDYGATWSDEDKTLAGAAVTGFPAYPTGAAPGDDLSPVEPWLMQAPNGDLLMQCWKADIEDYSTASGGSWQMRSTDGGSTWSSLAQINFVDIANDDLVFMTDDHFILDGVIYAGFREFQDQDSDPQRNGLVKSADNGATWTLVAYITDFSDNTIEVGFEYVGNNRIVAFIRGRSNAKTLYGVSDDLGATWDLEEIHGTTGIVGRPRIFTRAHLKGLDNWWIDNVLILVGFESITPGSWLDRRNAVWISQDRGETWDGPHYLDSMTDDAGYGDMIYDPINNLWVFVSYQGSTSAASLKQYNLEITGI